MEELNAVLDVFFSFKPYVMLPIIIFVIALFVRMRFQDAVLSSLRLAAGFAGVFISFDFFVANIRPAVEGLMEIRGISYPVLDVGWPPLAAITWASPLAPISIPLLIALNVLLLALGLSRTVYIDIWNYWHFSLLGVLVAGVTGSTALGLAAILVLALYSFKLVEWTALDVERETGIKGVSASPLSVNGIIPYAVVMEWLFDRIPGFRKLEFRPDEKQGGMVSLFSEPIVIGVLIGLGLGAAAAYSLKDLLELSVHIAAVMFLLPQSAGLIGIGMKPITQALLERIEKRFPGKSDLVVALDTGILMNSKSVILTGLLLMPCALVLAFLLPGNETLPLGDLPNLLSVMSLTVLLYRGNVIRAVLAGIPLLAGYLWIASTMAPLYTRLAVESGAIETGGGLITAFTDGGLHVRYLFFHLFQGNLVSLILTVFLCGALYMCRRRWKRMSPGPRL